MLGGLKSSLSKLWSKVKGESYITEEKLDEILKEFQTALIEADVKVDLAKKISSKVKEDILGEDLPEGIPLNNIVLKNLYDRLVDLLGEKGGDLNITPGKLDTILFVGLQGSGKTTSIAKVANYFKKRGYHVATICADTYRPGAYDQLTQLTSKINVKCFGKEEGNPLDIIKDGLNKFKGYDAVLIDTAGRHKEETALIEEMKKLHSEVTLSEVILVIDGMIGQRAYDQAKAFANTVPVGSVLVTKMDSSAKGGGALAAAAATDAPIKFIGTGESIEDIESYVPKRFVSRLLGMPDVRALEKISEELPETVKKGELSLKDMLEYFEKMEGGGLMDRLKGSLPGVSKVPENLIENRLKQQKAILRSMTEGELVNSSLIEKERSRIKRIAIGSGTSIKLVRNLLSQYKNLKKMTKSLMKRRNIDKKEALSKLMQGDLDPQLMRKIGAR